MVRWRDVQRQLKKWIVAALVPRAEPMSMPYPPRTIAVLSWERWGDAILLTSLLRGLHLGFPRAQITVYTVAEPARRFFHTFEQEYGWIVQRPLERGQSSAVAEPYDWIINPKDHFSATFLWALKRVVHHYRIGFAHPDYARYFHLPVVAPFGIPLVEKYRILLDRLGVAHTPEAVRPLVPLHTVHPKVRRWVAQQQGKLVLGINLSAGQSQRCLTELQAAAIIEHFAPTPVLLLATGKQQAIAHQLQRRYANVLEAPTPTSIFDAVALLQVVRLLVTPDTALVHAAAALRKPVVVLYLDRFWFQHRFAPYGIPARSLATSGATIAEISTSSIVAAIEDLLAEIDAT